MTRTIDNDSNRREVGGCWCGEVWWAAMLGHHNFFSVLFWFEQHNVQLGKEQTTQLYQSARRNKKISVCVYWHFLLITDYFRCGCETITRINELQRKSFFVIILLFIAFYTSFPIHFILKLCVLNHFTDCAGDQTLLNSHRASFHFKTINPFLIHAEVYCFLLLNLLCVVNWISLCLVTWFNTWGIVILPVWQPLWSCWLRQGTVAQMQARWW
jgi:hypothetical protein